MIFLEFQGGYFRDLIAMRRLWNSQGDYIGIPPAYCRDELNISQDALILNFALLAHCLTVQNISCKCSEKPGLVVDEARGKF